MPIFCSQKDDFNSQQAPAKFSSDDKERYNDDDDFGGGSVVFGDWLPSPSSASTHPLHTQ